MEPYELQRALSNHYTADKLSHLVCKHFNEWAYGSKYIGALVDEYDNFFKEAVKKDAKGKVLANQKELDAIKQERLDAFEAKVKQLTLWEDIEVRKSSYRSKYINGSLLTSLVSFGGYLVYKYGKWLYERMAYGDKKEEEIPLSPFPIDNPVVSHFHPVAFVEQMRRMGGCCSAKMNKEELKAIAYDSKDSDIEKHLPGLNEAFKNNSINTCLRKVHFLAQIIHESARLSATKEGGVLDTDYGGFPGRGLIQITGESNYKAYQAFSGEDVTTNATNKAKLESSPHAANSAGWFWDKKAKLNDEADENDFIYITMKINGGLNGYNHRLEYLKKGFLTYYSNCNIKKDISTEYKFNESKAYDNPIYAFAWGLWHDPDLEKTGCTKDKDEALKGYNRLINLTDSNYKIKNRYLIHKISEFSDLKDTEGKVKVREAAQKRINKLNEN